MFMSTAGGTRPGKNLKNPLAKRIVRHYKFSMPIFFKHADMRQVLPLIHENSLDCAIVDPPYQQTSLAWDKRVPGWPALVRRTLKASGSMWVFGSLRLFMETAPEFAGWRMSHEVIWEKHNGAGFFNDRFRNVHEIAAHFYKSDVPWKQVYKQPQFTLDATARTVRRKKKPAHWTGVRGPTVYTAQDGGPRLARSVQYVRNEHGQKKGHPTAKPEALIEMLLQYCCPPGGYVLDPFAGSGVVGVVAERLNRTALLVEADPGYAALIERRIK